MKILDETNYKFLFFKEVFESRGSWLTVHRVDPINYQTDENRVSEILINSALVSTNFVPKIKNSNKEVNFYDGYQPIFYQGKNNDFEVVTGYHEENGIKFYPFVYSRPSVGLFSSVLDIHQNFLLYHDLRKQDNDYLDPNDKTKVIQIDGNTIQINLHYLKDFLAAMKMCLIRYIGLFRSLKDKTLQEIVILPDNRYEIEIVEGNMYVTLIVSNHMRNYANSFLDGKQVIYPYKQPTHPSFRDFLGLDNDKFETFITNRDEDGNLLEETCDPSKAGLNRSFFDVDVLEKYYNNPTEYEIENASLIRKTNEWYLPFGINEENIVTVWLRDLGKIPHSEQLYWKSFNIPPLGSMSKNLIQTHLLAEYPEIEDPIFRLFQNRSLINDLFQKKLGFKLFKELEEFDQYLEKTTRNLYKHNQLNFDQQILNIAKVFNDYLNEHELKSRVKWRPASNETSGSIKYLEHFLNELYPEENFEIINDLRIIQNLRSKSSAHKKSKDYLKQVQEISDLPSSYSLKEIFSNVILNLNDSLVWLTTTLKNKS